MSAFLPVLRIAQIDAALMVESALMGYNPEAMATLLGTYILDLDREAALEAEARRLPVPLVDWYQVEMVVVHAFYLGERLPERIARGRAHDAVDFVRLGHFVIGGVS